jgi:hypothetical protein
MEKNLNQKSCNYFVWTQFVVEFTYSLFQLFATGFVDTGDKFTASVNDTGSKLPPVSTTPAVLVAKFAANVI